VTVVQHFVDFAATREAPEHVVRRLRSIDTTAELLWWGPRLTDLEVGYTKRVTVVLPVWLLGTVRPNAVRRRVAWGMLQSQEKLGPRGNRDTWRYARLLYQGFAAVAFYPVRDPTEAIAADFAERHWRFCNRFDEEGARALAESEGQPEYDLAVRYLVEKAKAEAPSLWHFALGKRRSVLVN
jgi:hypothetical protein